MVGFNPHKSVKTFPEYELQCACFEYIRLLEKTKFPELALAFHPENEGKRTKAQQGRALRAGLKAGVPDICIPVARGKYHGLYIELKHGRGRLTKSQQEYGGNLVLQGNKFLMLNNFDDFKIVLDAYLYMNGDK